MASNGFNEMSELMPVLSLGHTVLLFLPADMSSSNSNSTINETVAKPAHVVQVTIEPTEQGKRTRIADRLAAFFLVQHEVSELIVSILLASISHPFQTPMKFVQDDGATPYTLTVESQPWKYGKSLNLLWGDEPLVPGDLKWTFKFEAVEYTR